MFAFSRLLSAVPITPGGVGLIDLGYIGGLTAFDSLEKAQIVAAVLLFRALTYGIQIPIGGFTYIIWRVKSDWRRPRMWPRSGSGAATSPRESACRSCDVPVDGAATVIGLGAWCDFVTPDEYRQRLVRGGWRATVERQSQAGCLHLLRLLKGLASISDSSRTTFGCSSPRRSSSDGPGPAVLGRGSHPGKRAFRVPQRRQRPHKQPVA